MFIKVFLILAAAIVFILAAALYFICKKMFDLAISRKCNVVLGGDGFEAQLAQYKDVWDEGKKLFDSLEKEDVWMISFDGLKLHGTLIKNGDGKKLLIEAHGYRSSSKHDFIAAMPYFYNKGFSFLLIDQRAHGESEGEYITFGVCERLDMRDWVYFAMEKLGTDIDIFLHGISMGATTVLMASELDLPDNVKGIIADSGFTSPYDIFVRVLDNTYHSKPFPILNITQIMAYTKANFGFKDASTLTAMKNNRFPVAFVHGADDDFVPKEMSEKNYEACKTYKEIVIIEGARHACGYLVGREACEKALDAFFEKCKKA